VLALAVLITLGAIFFWLSFQRARLVLYAVVFLAPWQGLDVDVGLRITAYLAILAPLAVVTLLWVLERGALASQSTRASEYFFLFIAYAVIWSLFQLPFLPHAEVAGGELRSPRLRAVMQIPMFLLTTSPAFATAALSIGYRRKSVPLVICCFSSARLGATGHLVFDRMESDTNRIG